MLILILMLVLGLAIGALLAWLILRSQIATLNERVAGKNNRVSELEVESDALNARIVALNDEAKILTSSLAEAQTKLPTIETAHRQFINEFENLANRILDDKSKRFTDLNKSNLEALLDPLAAKILDFKQKVESIEHDRTKDQGFLQSELENLRKLNQQISEDAINLTNALKGQSKVLGDFGQIILEDVLEQSGLVREREFLIQRSVTGEDGRRKIPDVVVKLPNDRHLVIDAKASLAAYERSCSLPDGPERNLELKRHATSVREHIRKLGEQNYQDLYKLSSVDFVLMFVPFEPAFTAAMQCDPQLFRYAFDKRVIVVSPWTLLATMRTIENLWQPEKLNRNVLEIAKRAGDLYEKFVNFVKDLEGVGAGLNVAQASYEGAHKKLSSGKGSLVNKADRIRELGLKVKKTLPEHLLFSSEEKNSQLSSKNFVEELSEERIVADPQNDMRQVIAGSELDEDSQPLLTSKSAGAGES